MISAGISHTANVSFSSMAQGSYSSVTDRPGPSPVAPRCTQCGKPIAFNPRALQPRPTCDQCTAHRFMDARLLFTRGLTIGGAAAFVCLLLLACIELFMDHARGPSFFAIAVGWIVGRAFAAGSRGERGNKFAVAAAALTYLALALAPFPELLAHITDPAPAGAPWANVSFAQLPLWTLFSPFLIEKGQGLMGIVRICLFVAGLGVASRESGIARRGRR
jgi:hypothetical protein